jgi:hypothetical protein
MRALIAHRHAVARLSEARPFWFCVAPAEACVPAAHGGITYREECACGASRLVARRWARGQRCADAAIERGEWVPALVWTAAGTALTDSKGGGPQ